ncbi:SusD/RagB family nutrient-binding outer membrane lipoprotein [Hymenobacter nivis]|uniref:SusD/RagB family nutrient-binding outer membrane lipoprotein n=1 Tax=Hymenobacter nivis TaxID=1850093 RepID=UPI0013A58EB6|nr:SusD/RagB family nutrient-binding outer membrane lipoprotein [Hymenobacter nivis]
MGANPGVGTSSTTNLTPGSTITDFYGSWYARDIAGYFEVITYHELKFIEAEAAFRAGNKARALAALKEGIRAHMKKIGAGGTFSPPAVTLPAITDAQIAAYLASAAVPQTEADLTTLRPIMEQKYIALFLNPDSWSDLRRLDFDPNIYVNFTYPSNANPVLASKTDPTLRYPRRLLPGATEVLYNPAEIARIGGNDADYITRPMWFDSK